MQHWSARPRTEVRAELGEGSLWDVTDQCLWWVDIAGRTLFRFDPEDERQQRFDVPEPLGTVVVCSDGTLLLAQGGGLARLDPASKKLTTVANLEPPNNGNRLNDGKCDPKGRLWVGSIVQQGVPNSACLYCVDADFKITPLVTGVTNSNGLAWSSDERTFYYIDTPTQKVFAYDCDLERPTLSNCRTVFEFPADSGSPDGMTMDADGQLWVAMFGGGRVLRLDPQRGTLTGEVAVAAKNVTSCAFGGPEQNVLFITTARIGMSDQELRALPLSGSLFSVELPIQGVDFQRFRGR